MIELSQQWNEQVYDEIDDLGQQSMSLRWVMKEKVVNKKKITKARHVEEVLKRNKISGQIVSPAPEKDFDHPVVSYHGEP